MTNNATPASTRKPSKAGLTIGIVLLVVGFGFWINYVQTTGSGFQTSQLDTALVFMGFLLWAVPWLIGSFTSVLAARGRRKLLSLAVLPLGFLMLIVAVVTTITGAEAAPPPEFTDVP
ncbi:hypothetical protein GIY23_19455 [Allosaccharopolyspora coralli]|uniref:Uncharacterized protein n=1 Tax=Allosaccharopolyspora coralli TaxID=2665642 RepID=A0A5Q3QBZ8_9PSEU|nr:hypothetical protein [Allosaccharopolyspora coralli]QGK71400.1 hypothetical protein GIY23_19455 [Allosaccharopolyspora coralli]